MSLFRDIKLMIIMSLIYSKFKKDSKLKARKYWENDGFYIPFLPKLLSRIKLLAAEYNNPLIADIGGTGKGLKGLNGKVVGVDYRSGRGVIKADLDDLGSIHLGQIDLALVINVLQEPLNHYRLLKNVSKLQVKDSSMFIVSPVSMGEPYDITQLIESIAKNYYVKRLSVTKLVKNLKRLGYNCNVEYVTHEGHIKRNNLTNSITKLKASGKYEFMIQLLKDLINAASGRNKRFGQDLLKLVNNKVSSVAFPFNVAVIKARKIT